MTRHLAHLAAAALALAARPAPAQHASHAAPHASRRGAHLTWHAGVVPQVTRATPTAGGRSLTEGYLLHPVAMLHATRGTVSLRLMANLEGLTLDRGELATGVYGEGYVDRRHPHAWVHEAVLTGVSRAGPVALSLALGRGFAPFGSDDPMVRPLSRYPVNHHHAQVLERLMVVGAARVGPVTLELGTFNGDEPTSPGSVPSLDRVGDSWSARLTWRPLRRAPDDVELSASWADVRSPEDPTAVTGLDQRKRHAGARVTRPTRFGLAYLMTEWAMTDDYSGRRRVFRYGSALVEGSLCGRAGRVAARVERTARHEEERLSDLFRTPVPHAESSIIGITRWTTAGLHVGTNALRAGVLRAAPFAEATYLRPAAVLRNAAFEPGPFYGAPSLWQLSAGARIGVGAAHRRMGRYGVAEAPAPDAGHARHAAHARQSSSSAAPGAGC